ncbi:hypothetical protein [Solidesulfovibrio carbinolicus]|uniref:hypothetical protein n=1 Tax=Solidesulfovibrio carbinolicus TaxID=296842 RepID=UPI001011DCCD|nr:hypothetical protein [Solidesulfovibrio carbinolicus]
MLDKLKAEKPWAILKVTRRQYETARPWVKANLPRKRFEELLAVLPDGFVDHCHRDAEAERLVSAIFGTSGD